MKHCNKCNQDKPLSEFGFRNKEKKIVQPCCLACAREASKKHYSNNKQDYIKRAKHLQNKNKQKIQNLKNNKPCTDCNNTYPYYVMDFDHKDPTTKKFVLARGWAHSWKKIEEEIKKCDLVCANCHRIRSFERLSAKRHRPSTRPRRQASTQERCSRP